MKDHWGAIIELILLAYALVNFFSYFIWTFLDTLGKDPDDKWPVRLLLALVAFGFYGILRQMRKNRG